MKTVIIKYNAGNVQSVMYALERLGASYLLTDDEVEIRSADKVIFPGVGEASTAMAYLRERGLDKLIPSLKQPVLGTCVGMQLMCRYSEENNTTCMGIFDIDVRRFPARRGDGEPRLKVPHTGWNSIHNLQGPLTGGVSENAYVYFVHSYAADVCPDTTATCDYVRPFSAMLQRDNFYAAQFHAEISGNVGQRILENFLKL
ncbi:MULTISPECIES: imidazole glycerol phosphate synthase subunit HisH [unclassified Spirosoma]|uniref:imidazole glycerol phosphate synthase subunit HisH n=1 Tax=unclassified Spirosoma TaxID=2621999 RepID=UPI00096442FE|nr:MULTISPECIES: imidazole glycerol phosphate synthase subunit HisH [unclassified Spirosoma]MBN8825076.1 imidazole glycerol phosphate synthase subunit HisH [Spirosoma sp.]OJW73363.1 MAG: imidazole glycerol phosphate synthase, glutamine amidotransferase subunit [Spirosoma sp. 48-14]